MNNLQNKNASSYDERRIILKKVKDIVNEKFHVNPHGETVLRVSSGIAKIEIQMWILKQRDNEFHIGVNADDDKSKKILMSMFNGNKEQIAKQTGYDFQVNGKKGSWIESLLPYDSSKSIEEQAAYFASEYLKLIDYIRKLVSHYK
jgi:hypothetical protein